MSKLLEMDDFVSPSAAALSFVVQLATSRYKSTFPGIISFVKSVMENTYVVCLIYT